ncbi:hypothetical protein BpHYR1_014773 [Brachionus plicatilis]|uniref:Uncharacterized protein n=1 Tax=Brachionus plicatilis TaxID=10195 RepID=A0A3M7RWF6_BRAPC|nr:hypothetical protein BpHYR1_014773 [Brachionus plicatilis]
MEPNGKSPPKTTTYHRSKMNSFSSLIINCDKIDEKCSQTDKSRYQQSSNYHLSDPQFSSQTSVKTTTKKSIDWSCDSIHENGCVQQRSSFSVQFSHYGKYHNNQSNCSYLTS